MHVYDQGVKWWQENAWCPQQADEEIVKTIDESQTFTCRKPARGGVLSWAT